MPNDARLGLVVGVTVVILVAVLFVRKDSVKRGSPGRGPGYAPVAIVQLPSMAPPAGLPRPGAPRTHTVSYGETLMSLAVLYYQDAGQVSLLFRANRDRIMGPDRVPVGTVLRIPELPGEPVAAAHPTP